MFSQIPVPPTGAIESWLLSAAAIGSIALIAKKLVTRKPPESDFATKSELHNELNSVRDKIDARFLSLSEKIEHLGTTIHDRLNHLESGLARVDERTKK